MIIRDIGGTPGMCGCVRALGCAAMVTALTGLAFPLVAQETDSASILIYDASGSMWGQMDGGITKVEVAREVIGDFFTSRDNTVPLGVVAYGHNRRGDCSDIEVVAPVGVSDPAQRSASLNRLNPRGMTPITDSLALAASMIPPTAETADIILVTDGLETCEADPCALAAQLAQEGIAIRAHVVGFGLTKEEGEVMACVADATGGLLLTPQTGQELADALKQVAQVAVETPPEMAPPPVAEAFFDIGPKAEVGHTYAITYKGTARNADYAGFTLRGEGRPPAGPSFAVIGGGATANNPFTRRAPSDPGEYDLILYVEGQGVVARQPVEVVAASNGFDAIGSVEPGKRFEFTWRGPNQLGERIVIARPGAAPEDYQGDWGYPMSNARRNAMGLKAPEDPELYELRYLSANGKEILFSRQFGVGVPFEDRDATNTADLAAQAAAATQAEPGQDDLPAVRASFRIPDNFPQIPLWWSAVPLDSDMSPEAWAPISEMVIGEGEFEPGRYRVSTTGPGETEFGAIVEIFPGQENNFVIPVVGGGNDETSAFTISGPWQLVGVPPYQVQAGADQLLFLALEQSAPGAAIRGSWVAGERLAGPGAAGREGDFTEGWIEDDAIRLTFDAGAPISEPMSLYLRPYGIGYAGSLSSGGLGMSVVMWPGGYELPSLAEMREAVHGPAPADFVDMAAKPPETGSSKPTANDIVPVRLRTPLEIGDVGVQWSAIRKDVVEMDVAFASHDLETSFVTSLVAGGTYEVEGVNADAGIYLADTITIDPTGRNDFEIPLAVDAGSFNEDIAFACSNTPAGCRVSHAQSGIALTLPNGWAMGEPYFYETAGGAPSDQPSARFFAEQGGQVQNIELNPRQWLDSNGPCRPIVASQLCMMRDQRPGAEAAFSQIAATLTIGGMDETAAVSQSGSAMRIRTTSTTQFGAGCFIKFELDDASGETFTAYAPVSASSNGTPVAPLIGDEPVVMEIVTVGNYGAGLDQAMLGSACERLTLAVGPVLCRMGAPPAGDLVACPFPVEVVGDNNVLAVTQVDETVTPSLPSPIPATPTSSDVYPINLGQTTPEAFRQLLAK
jgi:hypothetical protein